MNQTLTNRDYWYGWFVWVTINCGVIHCSLLCLFKNKIENQQNHFTGVSRINKYKIKLIWNVITIIITQSKIDHVYALTKTFNENSACN